MHICWCLWRYWRPCRCRVHYCLMRELLSHTLDHLPRLNCCRTRYIGYEDVSLHYIWKSHWTPSLQCLGQELSCSTDHLKDDIYIENYSHEHRFNGCVTNISVLLTVDHHVIGRASHVADSVTCFTLIMSVMIEIKTVEAQGRAVIGESHSIVRMEVHAVLHPLNVFNISTGSAGQSEWLIEYWLLIVRIYKHMSDWIWNLDRKEMKIRSSFTLSYVIQNMFSKHFFIL